MLCIVFLFILFGIKVCEIKMMLFSSYALYKCKYNLIPNHATNAA